MKMSKKVPLIALTVALVGVIVSTDAWANNHADTGWSFSSKEWYEITEMRSKEDSTSAWGHVCEGGYLYGWERPTYFTLVDRYDQELTDDNGNSISYTAVAKGNSAIKVQNSAYQNGYRNVRMRITRDHTFGGTESGYWSPDSI